MIKCTAFPGTQSLMLLAQQSFDSFSKFRFGWRLLHKQHETLSSRKSSSLYRFTLAIYIWIYICIYTYIYIYIYIYNIYIYTYKDISFIATYMAVRIADREQRNKINFLHLSFSHFLFRV